VSLDCLVEILTEESDVIDAADVPKLMASLCLWASPAWEGDSYLAQSEAYKYDPSLREDDDPP
jgi:hypothetical protein